MGLWELNGGWKGKATKQAAISSGINWTSGFYQIEGLDSTSKFDVMGL